LNDSLTVSAPCQKQTNDIDVILDRGPPEGAIVRATSGYTIGMCAELEKLFNWSKLAYLYCSGRRALYSKIAFEIALVKIENTVIEEPLDCGPAVALASQLEGCDIVANVRVVSNSGPQHDVDALV
jgi:hypothetical protein